MTDCEHCRITAESHAPVTHGDLDPWQESATEAEPWELNEAHDWDSEAQPSGLTHQ